MSDLKQSTISARVTPRVRRLVEVAADAEGTTVSQFVADTVEQNALRRLAGEEAPGTREAGRSDAS